MNKKKFKIIIWPIIYSLLIISVCISAMMVFHSYYYTSIYVSGSSMSPTLTGTGANGVDYGIIDTHDYAINRLINDKQRFKIITTHYPFSNGGKNDYIGGYVHGGNNVIDENNASYKIKRVYAFPGESFKFDFHKEPLSNEYVIDFYVQKGKATSWEGVAPQRINFERAYENVDINKYKYEHNDPLGKDELWVMGDNYNVSFDCFRVKQPIYIDNLVGVLIAIEGRCKIKNSSSTDEDGTHISATCTDRQRYAWPRFY